MISSIQTVWHEKCDQDKWNENRVEKIRTKKMTYGNSIENESNPGGQRHDTAGNPFPICGWVYDELPPTGPEARGKHLAPNQRVSSVHPTQDRGRGRLFEI